MSRREERKFRYEWEGVVRRLALPSSVKLVAAYCAQYGDLDGKDVRPGNPRLALETGLSERTVGDAMRALRELGLLKRTRKGSAMGRRALADEFHLAIPENPADIVCEWNVRENRAPIGLVDDGKGLHLSRERNPRQKRAETPATVAGDTARENPPKTVTIEEEHRQQLPVITGNTGNWAQLSPATIATHHNLDHTSTTPTTTNGSISAGPLTSRAKQVIDTNEIDLGDGVRSPCPHGNSSRNRRDGQPRCTQCRHALTGKCATHGLQGGNRPDGKPRCTMCRVLEGQTK